VKFVRRISWPIATAAVLLALLATLATLQYRWLGDVSEAERERMRTSLRTRASDFAEAFDAELTRTYVAFHVDVDRLDADPAGAIADTYARWQASTSAPAIVKAIYLFDGAGDGAAQTQRLDVGRRTLIASERPANLGTAAPGTTVFEAIDARVPALVVPAPRVRRIQDSRRFTIIADPSAIWRAIVIVLDRDALRTQLVEPLVGKYFGDTRSSEYFVSIVRRDDPAEIVFASAGANTPGAPAVVDASSADVTTGLFALRLDEMNRLAVPGPGSGPAALHERMAITIVARANGVDAKRIVMAGGDGQGAWQLGARYRSGSLDAIVAQSRRRNLAIGLGVLGLLGASFVLVVVSAQRQQRLARQQMEFVAAVSHELRTPLAVIRSAGENLADGVVDGGEQVKRYGALIQAEGRRLTDMVERVMRFAGIASGTRAQRHVPIDIRAIVADVVTATGADARERGVTVNVRQRGAVPPVVGDADALRSAVENIVGNAIKYSPGGSVVDVSVGSENGRASIRVVDRGLGIDGADLPHVDKPFYRGRRAVDAQIRGTGIGLSVVRSVVDDHGGELLIASRPGEGTTVDVLLDVAQPRSHGFAEPAPPSANGGPGGSSPDRPASGGGS
jgi:signal transduction histidine kinase